MFHARIRVAALALLALSCTKERKTAVSLPFDVSSVVTKVQRSFRSTGEAFTARHAAYDVLVERAGAVLVTAAPAKEAEHRGAALRFETIDVSRRVALATGETDAVLRRDGQIEIARGDAVERLRVGEEGLEQSWTFLRSPDGDGDLVVRVRVTGIPYATATESGLHFLSADEAPGFRYGRATWIDGSGRFTDVETTFEDGNVVLRVPAAVVDSSVYPAVLDPIISAEMEVDRPYYPGAAHNQVGPAVAFSQDSNMYLVVWGDSRSGQSGDIFGTRVNAAGEVLDPEGIPICTHPTDQLQPAVAFRGGEFFVVWVDSRTTTQSDIYGARLTPGGEIVPGEV